MINTKVFAAFLPQYHETIDNNKFWGKGYTDWVGVKKALPQYEGHEQPKCPMNDRYYDLTDPDTLKWQAELARKYGIYGFNIYHYWFKDGKQELEKPAEMLLEHKEIDINYFFTWDNASWKRTWDNIKGNDWAPAFDNITQDVESKGLLVEFQYGEEEQWEKHFMYLLPFFKDERYYKINNKPVFMFINRSEEDTLIRMGQFWNRCAIENGFNGIYIATKKKNFFSSTLFDAEFRYEPEISAWGKRRAIDSRLNTMFGIQPKRDKPVKYIYSYDMVWKKILQHAKREKGSTVIGAFVKYDDTPRRGKDAMIIRGESPTKFRMYFEQLYRFCCKKNKEFMLLTAWNEWGEGAYLEPDTIWKYAYLEAIKDVIEK